MTLRPARISCLRFAAVLAGCDLAAAAAAAAAGRGTATDRRCRRRTVLRVGSAYGILGDSWFTLPRTDSIFRRAGSFFGSRFSASAYEFAASANRP